jgi:pilus assembly protein CpaB
MTMRSSNEGGGEQVNSNIILEDIRVLAVGDDTQAQDSGEEPETIEAGFAVLELTAEDARILAHADELGTISLALRGVQVETVGMRGPSRRSLGQQSGVRIHQYGTVSGGGR